MSKDVLLGQEFWRALPDHVKEKLPLNLRRVIIDVQLDSLVTVYYEVIGQKDTHPPLLTAALEVGHVRED
jgi:hypothetical protein